MKITTKDLATLSALIEPLNTSEVRAAYLDGRFPRADAVKDLDKRFRWDLFAAATRGRRDLADALYAYLNDAHIDTALRSIVAPLNGAPS